MHIRVVCGLFVSLAAIGSTASAENITGTYVARFSNAAKLIQVGIAYHYFRAIGALPVQWRGLDKRPIPDDWHTVGWRKSKLATVSRPNWNATHPVQAISNYAYGVLENDVRTQIIVAGLDPTIGVIHGHYEEKLPLVYDLMEPLRPLVHRQILGFVAENVFDRADFTIRDTGEVRHNPQLARVVAALVDSSEVAGTIVVDFALRDFPCHLCENRGLKVETV